MKQTLLLTATLIGFVCAAQKFDWEEIGRYTDARHQFRNFNGSILVAHKGQLVFSKNYGFEDLALKKPRINSNTVFNSCSISKEFTATGIMWLRERGLLKLQDSLRKYFPELPYSEITIRTLLNHTSGLVSSEFLFKEWTKEREMTQADLLALLVEKKPMLLYPPGQYFSYSNIGYVLLGMIIEKVSKSTYPAFMKKVIFEPLKMSRTFVRLPGSTGRQFTGYLYDYVNDSALTKSYFEPSQRADWKKALAVSGLYGSGNIFTTAADLIRWQDGLNKNRILKKSSYREMTGTLVDARGTAGIQQYGYGFSVNAVYGDTMIFHNGGTLGFSTTLRHLKNKDITIVTVSNTNRGNDPVEGMIGLLYNQDIEFPTRNSEIKLTTADLLFFTGEYEAGGRQFSIELVDGTLYREAAGVTQLRLVPKSKHRLYYSDGSDRELVFREQAGKILVRLVRADGLAVEIKKTGEINQ